VPDKAVIPAKVNVPVFSVARAPEVPLGCVIEPVAAAPTTGAAIVIVMPNDPAAEGRDTEYPATPALAVPRLKHKLNVPEYEKVGDKENILLFDTSVDTTPDAAEFANVRVEEQVL